MKNLWLLLPLALAACSHGTPAPTDSKYGVADYQPLAVGNTWTYAGQMMGQQIGDTITIVGQKEGYFVDNKGNKLKVDSNGLRDDKRVLLAPTLEKGAKWSSIVSVSSTERYEIVDAGFQTTVPAGTFSDCVKVRGVNKIDARRSLQVEWTYAPGVGLVRIASSAKDGDKELPQSIIELKSFKLAGEAKPVAKE